MPSGNNSVLV